MYERFRDPLRGATTQAAGDAEGPQFVHDFDEKGAIEKYQQLITELPPLNRQLLLYILDLLAVFAAKSDENRMTSQNLAAIFQPGMLSHPSHAMAPEEYRLNQCVIIFLIENQDHFLIGMQGTAADEQTVQEVESGTPQGPLTPAVTTNKPGLDRSASTASAGAESVRKDGKLRRNRSVSSKHSKDGSNTPTTPVTATTPTGGLGRSNTVPSKKSPAIGSGKFRRNDGQDSSPAVQPLTPARLTEASMSQQSSPTPATESGTAQNDSGRSQERLLDNAPDAPPVTRERNISNLFQRSATDASEKRQPNKLRKKKIPGTMNISAHSSNASLPHPHSNAASPNTEAANPIENTQPLAGAVIQPPTEEKAPEAGQSVPQESQSLEAKDAQAPPAASNTLRPNDTQRGKSPSASTHSSHQGASDPDQAVDEQVAPTESPEKDKKKRWRLSRAKKDDTSESNQDSATAQNLGVNQNAEQSTTSFSSAGKPRRSFQAEGSEQAASESQDGKDKDESKGPLGWIKHKYREAKENAEQRRNKSPSSPERQGAGVGHGKSIDLRRDQDESHVEGDAKEPKAEPTAETGAAAEEKTPTTEPSQASPPNADTEPAHAHDTTNTIKEEPTEEAAAEARPPTTSTEETAKTEAQTVPAPAQDAPASSEVTEAAAKAPALSHPEGESKPATEATKE